MKNSTLITKVHMNCPICGMTHEVEKRKRMTSTVIKGDKVEYEEMFYYCINAKDDENEFETGSMTSQNLLNARNAYRLRHGLLTSNQIVEIRESYGLSQVDLARLLGWGEATISRYESKAIQDEPYDFMLRLIKDNPLQTLEFLNRNSSKFSEVKRRQIYTNIMDKLDAYGKEYLARKALEAQYAAYMECSDSNGFTALDIAKIETIISYMAECVTELYKFKLMNMLWYVDALSYKTKGKAVTGLVYRHYSLGTLPVGYNQMMNLEGVNTQEQIGDYDIIMRIYPAAEIDYSIISSNEKEVLDAVINQFKDYTTKEIVDYSNNEEACSKTHTGDIIPFSLAKDIKAF